MKEIAISVTTAARNFNGCVNRAYDQNVTFVLLKNGKHIARLVPHREKVCSGAELAKALKWLQLAADEYRGWRRDMRAAKKTLKPPADK